ncbi:hypothetical protein [Nonomuraea sp. LPB2021202275-12-8]|uniref:hypothetical protein n=1 Tax=Nonomuraea sp. LPB2021202275-12-8 TaxID=3120159 RepID=UPI00300DB640
MSVYGGLEYTEDSIITTLLSYPGNVNPGVAVPPAVTLTVGGAQIGVYNIAPANVAWLGAQRNNDFQVLQADRVRLTNDTITAEWIIEGHRIQGLGVDAMMQNMKQDVASLIALRQQLKHAIDQVQAQHMGDHIILAPGAPADIFPPGPQGLFWYSPGAQVKGAAQITVQYENLETITRICQLNASKFLPGKKVEAGDDADMVAGTLGPLQLARYNNIVGTSSFAGAQNLLQELTKLATPVVGTGGVVLSKAQVGLIMLMVLNDAMASTMRRHASPIGQSADKNIQRFFPKSRRRDYVWAVAQHNVADMYLGTLRANITNAAAAMAQLAWNSCDPFALDIGPTQTELSAISGPLGPAQAIAQTQQRGRQGNQVLPMEIIGLKDAVLGANGATLAAWIARAALAYTDTNAAPAPATDHYNGLGHGNVIISLNFSPVTPHVYGAVYEFRDHEVPMTMEHRDEVLSVMRKLFTAA